MDSAAARRSMSSSEVVEVLRSFREITPYSYLMKIQNFPLLAKSDTGRCESRLFEVGNHKWKLILYPNGDKKANGEDHVSLYLGIEDVAYLPRDWEVFAEVEFFVYNQLQDKYLSFQEINDVKTFHSSKREWGIPKLLKLQTFNDPQNGYLVNGCCSFGVRVNVININKGWESISITDKFADARYTWIIHRFSTKDESCICSEEFTIGKNKWKLTVDPRGDEGKDWLSIYLVHTDVASLPENGSIHARVRLRVLDQRPRRQHIDYPLDQWYKKGEWSSWGYRKFMKRKDLYDKGRGFLVNDTLIVEVEFETVSSTTYSL